MKCIDEDGRFFSTRFVETQIFKSKNVFGADAMDIWRNEYVLCN